VREQDEKDQEQLLEENEGMDASMEAPVEQDAVEEGGASLEGQLTKLQKDHEELKDKYLRQAAEFENFKRRTVREKLDMISNAAQQTMRVLLPILDDFDRVKASSELPNSTEPFSEGGTDGVPKAIQHPGYPRLTSFGIKRRVVRS
jgi:molecular chaperone GrpE